MSKIEISDEELNQIQPGEAITLATVMAILAIAIITVIAYRLFMSGEGTVKLPGGYSFQWT